MVPVRYQRLKNLHLLSTPHIDPVDVVKSLVAVQAQEFPGAKWSVGQRTINATDEVVEQAFAAGRILRLHVMRPTWHFVAADDIRWLINLTAPRIKKTFGYYFRKAELDDKIIRRTNKILTRALRDGKYLTRDELREVVRREGVEPGDPLRFGHIMFHAELDGVVCSGPRKGKQFTYALLAERVPTSRLLERDEALSELALRYFTTRGPASVHDFGWWSGLTLTNVRRGIDIAGPNLKSEVFDGKTYWRSVDAEQAKIRAKGTGHLLSSFDEYFISYKDRSAGIHPHFNEKASAAKLVFDAPLVVDGYCVGGWKRALTGDQLTIQLAPRVSLKRTEIGALRHACDRFAEFQGKVACEIITTML